MDCRLDRPQESISSPSPDPSSSVGSQRFRHFELLMRAPAAICLLLGPDHVFELANDAYLQLVGRTSASEIVGKSVREALPEIAGQGYLELLDRVYQKGERFVGDELPVNLQRQAGSPLEERFVNLLYEPMRDEAGAVEGIMVHAVDVTPQVRARREVEALAEASEKQRRLYETILSNTPDLVYVFALDHTFTYANKALLHMWGRTFEDSVGKNCLELGYEPWHAEMHDREIEQVVATRQPIRGVVPFNGTDGRRMYDYIFTPVAGENGEVEAVAGTTRDVTDRIVAEDSVRESAELFRTVFEQAPDDAVVVMDAHRIVTAWNPAAERICGWSAEEAIGQPCDIIFTAEDRAADQPGIEAAKAAEEGKAADERWHVRKDASRFWGSGTMNSLHDDEGNVRGFLKIFRDATERHEFVRQTASLNEELEQKVVDRTRDLQEAVSEAEAFNYSISHDLRSPLRHIAATSHILLEDAGDDLSAENREVLERQAQHAARLGQLIDELLRLSRLGRAAVERKPLNMTTKAKAVASELEIACHVEVQEGMTGTGDPGLVRTVFQNLIGNACKFSPTGSIVRVGQTGDTFWVKDQGVGFDMKYVQKIFLPFERLVREDEFPGTGIGLANVERIIRRHGGRVWAESEPGHGATFFFTLG